MKLLKLFNRMIENDRRKRELVKLDSRLLKDIGLNRCDVDQILSKPIWKE